MKLKALIIALVLFAFKVRCQPCDTINAQYYIAFTLFKYGQYVSYSSTVFPGYDKHVTALKTPLLISYYQATVFIQLSCLAPIMNT